MSLLQGKVNHIQQACTLLPQTGNEQQSITVILRDYLAYIIRFSFLSGVARLQPFTASMPSTSALLHVCACAGEWSQTKLMLQLCTVEGKQC